jgi:hypothetical protein
MWLPKLASPKPTVAADDELKRLPDVRRSAYRDRSIPPIDSLVLHGAKDASLRME